LLGPPYFHFSHCTRILTCAKAKNNIYTAPTVPLNTEAPGGIQVLYYDYTQHTTYRNASPSSSILIFC